MGTYAPVTIHHNDQLACAAVAVSVAAAGIEQRCQELPGLAGAVEGSQAPLRGCFIECRTAILEEVGLRPKAAAVHAGAEAGAASSRVVALSAPDHRNQRTRGNGYRNDGAQAGLQSLAEWTGSCFSYVRCRHPRLESRPSDSCCGRSKV